MTADLLYQLLSERYSISRMGRDLSAAEFSLPVFFTRGEEPRAGQAYFVRSMDLPRSCGAACLFLCVGGRPSGIWSSWRGSIFYVEDSGADLFSVSNHILQSWDRITAWQSDLQQLLEQGAPLEDLVRISIPLFQNCITITDYNLRILVNSDVVGDGEERRVEILHDFERVPDSVSAAFPESFAQYALRREPFFLTGQLENPEGRNYCINLYLGNSYFGTCTLWEKLQPMRERDLILFRVFADMVVRYLSAQPRKSGPQAVTLKSIFTDLLRSFPVSGMDLDWAVRLVEKNLKLQGRSIGVWHCLAIRSANKHKLLTEEYICDSLEDMLPYSTAVFIDDLIAVFCMIPDGENCEDTVCDILAPYLSDMNFRAGVSAPFTDLYKALDHYHLASAIMRTGLRYAPEQYIYRFSDFILPYMLRHSVGEFDAHMLFSNGLHKLQEMDSGVDYWDTLRRYLDNECNASKTAQDLYLHRSSLLPRLEKIRSLVDLDTPEDRLYLRMCITLHDMEEERRRRH